MNVRVIAQIYRDEHRTMQREIMDLALSAEAKGFPLLAGEILDFGTHLENGVAPAHRGNVFYPAVNKFRDELRDLDWAWRELSTLIRPAQFEIERRMSGK